MFLILLIVITILFQKYLMVEYLTICPMGLFFGGFDCDYNTFLKILVSPKGRATQKIHREKPNFATLTGGIFSLVCFGVLDTFDCD